MPFHDVACDFSRMTGSKVLGDAETVADRVQTARFFNLDGEPRLAEVLRPSAAAAAAGVLVDQDARGRAEWQGRQRDP